MVFRAAFAAIVACSAASCCNRPTKPCVAWVRKGETYRVELVQHFDAKYSDYSLRPNPYAGFQSPELTCGRGLDLDEGSVVFVKAGKSADVKGVACPACNETLAIPEVPGVERVGDSPRVVYIGELAFGDIFAAKVGDQCMAVYEFGIAQVGPYFIQHSNEYVATDYMLYRMLKTSDYTPCLVPGSKIAEQQSCWDSWAVRIFDSKGRMITRDLPLKPSLPANDAGSNDGGP